MFFAVQMRQLSWLWSSWHRSLGNKRCLPLSRCWREQCSAKTLHLSQNVLTLHSLMAVLNDFAFNGGIVPTQSGTGRPRILCGHVSPNEIFNHYSDSGRTDNLKKKKNPCWMKGLTAASVCCSANVGYRGRCERLCFFASLGAVACCCGCASKSRSKMWTAGRDTGSLLVWLGVLPQCVSGKRRRWPASSSDWCSSCKRFKRRTKRQQRLRCFL